MSIFKKIFSSGQSVVAPPPKTAEELGKEWKLQLRNEKRALERQIRKIQREEAKVRTEAKKAAKENEVASVRLLAKEILHARKTVQRLRVTQTTLDSVAMQIGQQLSQLKVVGGLQKSGEIMQQMNELCRVDVISATMQEMSKEMTKAGLLDEMIGDALDDALDDDVEEDELEEEVAAVVQEVMKAKLKGARVGRSELPDAESEKEDEEPVAEEEDEEEAELQAKVRALKARA